ncbi:uncharacterized protein [Clytia hemisphaerica]|uniref:Uncharacterized protein n=1 Tax=Clytia hemisphaerica TaxID=252671 RepID=A0A7M5V4I4_9CNID
MKILQSLVLLFVVSCMADDDLSNLQNIFGKNEVVKRSNDHLLNDAEFETQARDVYMNFLKTSSLTIKDNLGSYFKLWREVVEIPGPFATDVEKKNGISQLRSVDDFMPLLFLDDFLDNRDEDEEDKKTLFDVLFSNQSSRVKFFFAGDDDIINGLVLASQYKNGDVVYIMHISD